MRALVTGPAATWGRVVVPALGSRRATSHGSRSRAVGRDAPCSWTRRSVQLDAAVPCSWTRRSVQLDADAGGGHEVRVQPWLFEAEAAAAVAGRQLGRQGADRQVGRLEEDVEARPCHAVHAQP